MPDAMSGCFFGPYVLSYDAPVDCPITIVERASDNGPAPKAWVYRGNTQVDVTGEVEDLGAIELETVYYETDCNGTVLNESRYPELYKRVRLRLEGAEVGEQLWVNWYGAGIVQASTGTCPADLPIPEPSCNGTYQGCRGDDFPIPPDGGIDKGHGFPIDIEIHCSAAKSPAWLVGAGVALLIARRRNAKRRSR